MRLAEVDRPKVEAYQSDRLADGASPRTVNIETSILRRVLSRAVEVGELESSPLARCPMLREAPARQPVLGPEQEAALLAACPEWLARVVRAAIATGARQGELLAARWRDVDFDNAALIIPTSKSGESRRVPIPSRLLDELRARRGAPEGWVFTNRGHPIPRDTLAKAWRKARARAGLPDLHFHDLRHVAATRWLASGASLPEVAAILGHKTLSISRRYAHPK